MHGQDTDKLKGPLTRAALNYCKCWLRGVDLNHRPLGYEPNELPDCSTPQFDHSNQQIERQTICGFESRVGEVSRVEKTYPLKRKLRKIHYKGP